MYELFREFWPHLIFALDVTLSMVASAHVVLHKRDTRSSIGWVGIIWLAPLFGTVLYILFGVNRISRRAQTLRAGQPRPPSSRGLIVRSEEQLEAAIGEPAQRMASVATLVGKLTQWPLLAGNHAIPLADGGEAYPAMLGAIDSAKSSLTLTTYIFDYDASGIQFIEALCRAKERGVEVRVIVDGVGRRYSWRSVLRPLRNAGIRAVEFLPTFVPGHFRYANLRSHRKIMVVDGEIGFTGGMNIRHGNTLEKECRHPIRDLHFRVEGPVVGQLQEIFALDWAFCTGEVLSGPLWFPPLAPKGQMLARGVPDGPDEGDDKLLFTMLAALACARESVTIVTPYFIPDDALITALNICAMRGVEVNIVVPKQNNLLLIQWAMTPVLRMVMDSGCRVWQSPPPFDHSKLMVVDGVWSFIGSANWDQRSLQLNFEFNVEVYDAAFACALEAIARRKMDEGVQLTAEEIDAQPIWRQIRNGIARLGSPYL